MLKSHIDKATGFEKRFENINTVVYENSILASKSVAKEIADLIKVKQAQKQACVLGLATGSSPNPCGARRWRRTSRRGQPRQWS